MEIKVSQNQPFLTFFESTDEVEVIQLKENEVQGLKLFVDKGLQEDFTYDHLHYDWIKKYESFNLNEVDHLEEIFNENFLKSFHSLNTEILKMMGAIYETYHQYIQEMDHYINPKPPSVDSYKNIIKYTSFLSSHKSNFYIDAETGFFGCTIKKKIGKRKKKSIDLLFKSNYEIVFCLMKDMNNLIYLRGVADFDDNLEDVKAVRWLLDY